MPGITRPIISIAIRLRAPAIATGVQSMDLMRTPPRDQRNAVASNSTTCLFKAEIGIRLLELGASSTRGTPTLHYVHRTRTNYSAPGEDLFPAAHSERNLDRNPDPGCPN